jgi:hypothetical protein
VARLGECDGRGTGSSSIEDDMTSGRLGRPAVHAAGTAATLALALGIAAGPAQAAPGKPSLYEVPAVTQPTFAPDKVVFGWAEVPFDPGSTNRRYTLTAYAGNQVVSTTVPASGNTSQDNGTTLQLSSPSGYTWTIKLTALEDLGGQIVLTTADPVYTVFDHDGPTVRSIGLANGIAWTRLPSLPVTIVSDPDSDAASGQVDVDSAGFECANGAEPECPIAVSTLFPVQFGRVVAATRDLPPGDGIKTVWVRFRDGARFTKVSRQVPIFAPLPGNPGPAVSKTIGLDTTPPDALLASATVTGTAGQPVTLDATPSTDASSGVSPNAFVWRWGDGSADQTGAGTLTHTYPGPGVYDGRVIVHDQAGTATDPADTNFTSTTFTVTINPAAVGGGGTGAGGTGTGTGPGGTGAHGSTTTPGGGASGGQGAAGAATPGSPSDIPFSALSQTPAPVAKGHGTLASARVVGKAKVKHPIGVRLSLRRRATVKLRLRNSHGKTVTSRSLKHAAGRFTAHLPGPRKAGRYKVVATAGSAKLSLPVKVVKG